MGDHQVDLLVLNCRLSPRREDREVFSHAAPWVRVKDLLVLNCRLSPKTERDVPETAGTGGRRRRMFLRWKAKTGGLSV